MNHNKHSPALSLAILISGNGSNLQAFIDAIPAGLNARIAVVISNQVNAYGLERARAAHIPTEIILSSAYNTRPDYDLALQHCIEKYHPDLIILAGFMRILTPDFVQHFKNRILNIHPSLLPNYPGLHTHQQVINAKQTLHGTTVHVVTADLDAGPIIAQSKLTVLDTDDVISLKAKVQQLEHQLYPQVIQLIAEGRLKFQDSHVLFEGQILPAGGLIL